MNSLKKTIIQNQCRCQKKSTIVETYDRHGKKQEPSSCDWAVILLFCKIFVVKRTYCTSLHCARTEGKYLKTISARYLPADVSNCWLCLFLQNASLFDGARECWQFTLQRYYASCQHKTIACASACLCVRCLSVLTMKLNFWTLNSLCC